MKMRLGIFLVMGFAACTSPYAAANIPVIPGVDFKYTNVDQAELTISHDLPNDCQYIRDAVLLTSARASLQQGFDHFEFSEGEDESKAIFFQKRKNFNSHMYIHLCRGTCPLMYSADSISHMLVVKFSKATWGSAKQTEVNDKSCKIT